MALPKQIGEGASLTMIDQITSLEDLKKALSALLAAAKDPITQFQNSFKDAFSSLNVGIFSGLGESIGDSVASGGNVIEKAGKAFSATIGEFVITIGKALIKYGIVKSGLDKILSGGIAIPGVAAIALGVAAVAIGTLIKQSFSQAKKFSKGGIVPGHGNGDTVPAMLTPGELVIPKDKVSQVQQFLSGVSLKLPVGNFASSFKDTINSLQLGPERTAPISRASGMVGAFTQDTAPAYLPRSRTFRRYTQAVVRKSKQAGGAL
jgi:hypothetical protein